MREAQAALTALLADRATLDAIDRAGDALIDTFKARGRVFACGNVLRAADTARAIGMTGSG